MTLTAVIRLHRESIHTGPLTLVNRNHSVAAAPSEDSLAPVGFMPVCSAEEREPRLEAACLRQLEAWMQASGAAGQVGIVSGYRTRERQRRIYEDSLAANGEAFTASYVAPEGRSEHQTGLAVDLGELRDNVDYIRPSLPDFGVFAELKRLASAYGFIVCYKEGKEKLTGIASEPWHFRYVGVPHARIMEERDWCLEEYIEGIRRFTQRNPYVHRDEEGKITEIFFVRADAAIETAAIAIDGPAEYEWSGNNIDGYIVTVHRGLGQGTKTP